MLSLYDRLADVLAKWHAADEFNDADYQSYVSDLESAVLAWLNDGATSLSREG